MIGIIFQQCANFSETKFLTEFGDWNHFAAIHIFSETKFLTEFGDWNHFSAKKPWKKKQKTHVAGGNAMNLLPDMPMESFSHLGVSNVGISWVQPGEKKTHTFLGARLVRFFLGGVLDGF